MQKIYLDKDLELFNPKNRITLINGLSAIHLSKDRLALSMSDSNLLLLIGKLVHNSQQDLEEEAIPELLMPFIHKSELWDL